MSSWVLEYYETTSGRCPVREYLDSLRVREFAAVRKDLDLLEMYGIQLGAPAVKHLEGKVWELRTRGQAEHRVLYVAVSGQRLIMLHAFMKKTQRTPRREIETAQRRLADCEQRGLL